MAETDVGTTNYTVVLEPFEWTDGTTLYSVRVGSQDDDISEFTTKTARDAALFAKAIAEAIRQYVIDCDVEIECMTTVLTIELENVYSD